MKCPRCKSEACDSSNMEQGTQHNCHHCGKGWFVKKDKPAAPVAEPKPKTPAPAPTRDSVSERRAAVHKEPKQ